MQFHVGPVVYTVTITPGELYSDWFDEELIGLCLHDGRKILISGACRPDERIEILFHELRHAFCAHHGRAPGDEEDDANNAATFAISMWRQLQSQGGEAALRAMVPTEEEC